MPTSAATWTRLQAVAGNNGFDLTLPRAGDWLAFASTQVSMKLWVTAVGEDFLVCALSQGNVLAGLAPLGVAFLNPLPMGSCGGLSVTSLPAMHALVRRAFQLAKSMPDDLLNAYYRQTAAMPKTTEAERLVVQRVGQDLFRQALLDYWQGRCALTGLAVPELLRASHIQAWAECDSDAARLDVHNGLLLAPHIDALFDGHWLTVADDGSVIVSACLAPAARELLQVQGPAQIRGLQPGHRHFLNWHRARLRAPH